MASTWASSRCFQAGLVFRRVERQRIALVPPQRVEQAERLVKQPVHRRLALLADQVVGIEASGQGDERQRMARAQQGQGAGRGAHGGTLPRRVAVEAQDRRIDETPEQLDLAVRSARCPSARPLPRFPLRPARSRPCSLRPPRSARSAAMPALRGAGCRGCGPCRTAAVSGEFRYLGASVFADVENSPAKSR